MTNYVLQSPLWQNRRTDSNPSVSLLQQQVATVVAACWRQWQAAIRAFPQDPWRDEGLPIRSLGALELLVFRSDPPLDLTDAEIALVIAVPFIREAALANGIVHMANANPLSLKSDTDHIAANRVVLEREHQSQPRFSRKSKRLQEQEKSSDSNAVLAWLLYHCLFKNLKLWEPESENGYLTNSFYNTFTEVGSCKSRLASETFMRDRLLELTRCMYADLERIDRDDRPHALKNKVIVGRYREEQPVREKMLGYLLQLAGILAIDIRMLSDVVVDHIGLADPLTPHQILQTVNKARWNPVGRGRLLRVTCNHQAVDLALREHVEHGNSVLTHIFRQVAEKRPGTEILAGLPTHLMADGITAEQLDGISVYQTPHVHFQLAHDEVRELLMGEQLYGDPMLAIRELYQNAMDACRYREARISFLKQTGQFHSSNSDWEAYIVFRQQTDETGRAYIECEDNGIGMQMSHLSKCFARAGRRFADLPEFIEEQAEWLKGDPPIQLYPNSQFGVGVLSYFMLADEIEVDTCRLDRNGQPGERLQIRIPGSSGLFRVRRLGIGSDAGTRVRLYLNRTRHKGQLISCIETLRKLLWIANFRTEAQQFGRKEVWEPGKLRHPDFPQKFCLEIDGTDIWWVPEIQYWQQRGCILSDGLWTRNSEPGLVFNLRKEHLPKLTVDRRDIIDFDQFWMIEEVKKNVKPLAEWIGLDLQLLWKLSKRRPQIAECIIKYLSEKDTIVQLGAWSFEKLEIDISRVGCYEPDHQLVESRYGLSIPDLIERHIPWWILPFRIAVWEEVGLFNTSQSCLKSIPPLMKPEFCPKLLPGDGIILNEELPPDGWITPTLQEYVPPAHIAHAAFKLDEPIAATVKRFQKFAPLGLEIPLIADQDSLDKIGMVSEEDIIALSRMIREEISFLSKKDVQWRYPWTMNRISAAQIVFSSIRLDESLADSIRRFQRFSSIGLITSLVNLEKLERISVTPEDIIALSKRLDGESALSWDKISPIQIAATARKLNESIASTVKRFRRFLPIGLALPNINYDTLDSYMISHEDVVAQSIIEEETSSSKDTISIKEIIQISGRLNEPIVDTVKRLQEFIPLGLKIQKDVLSITEQISLEREDLIAFSESFRSSYNCSNDSWDDNLVTPAHIVKASLNLNQPVREVVNRFQKFSPLGLRILEFDMKLLEDFVDSEQDLIALSRSLTKEIRSPKNLLEGKVHPTRIILAALALKEPVPQTLKRFNRFAPLFGLILPKGEPDSWRISWD